MNFELDEEQTLIRDSVARFLRDNYAFEDRTRILRGPHGYLESHWSQFAELGWLGAALPESVGGLGAGVAAHAVLAEQFGRALLVSPYLASVVLGAGAVLAAGDRAQAEALVAPVVEGRTKLALAFAEPAARYDLEWVETRAHAQGSGYRIDGHKCAVFFAPVADHLIVSARTAGGTSEPQGIGLFSVAASAPGVRIEAFRTQDGASAADCYFDGVQVGADAVLGDPAGGYGALVRCTDEAGTALGAEAVGAMWATYDRTLEYLKVREQFGAPLARLQALQHRMVDAYMHCQLAQSMSFEALAGAQSDDIERRAKAVSGARAKIARSARLVAEESIQLHGGVGMMAQMPIGHYLKRVTMINATLGDADWHLARYARLRGTPELEKREAS